MRVKLTEKYRPKTLTDVVGQGMEYCQIYHSSTLSVEVGADWIRANVSPTASV